MALVKTEHSFLTPSPLRIAAGSLAVHVAHGSFLHAGAWNFCRTERQMSTCTSRPPPSVPRPGPPHALSRDKWLHKPSTGSLAALLHNLLRNKKHEPALRFLRNRCQLACRGVRARGGGRGAGRLKWTPETSCRGRGVVNVCFRHGLCQRV